MRFLLLVSFLTVFAAGLVPASAQVEIDPEIVPSEPILPDEPSPAPPVDDVPLADSSDNKRLDDMFALLKRTSDPRFAKPVADGIWAEWFRSGSASIDLMMHWSNEAVRDGRYFIALDFLDQIVIRKPEFAEGWNRRATLHYQMNNFSKSMADVQKTLLLEPRHFGALSGMAAIFEQTGNKQAALEAWERVADIYPAMPSAQETIIRLSEELADDPA